jgi:hypothetical protein
MSENSPDLGAMVSRLLENPELISQIASTVGVDMQKAEPTEEKKEAEAKPASAGIGGILPLLTSMGGSSSRRTALLSALKPFCNEHRCRTIDYMISISRLSDSLGGRRE